MIAIDTDALVLGLCAGTLLSVCFFASLAYSVRLAMRSSRPPVVLFVSSVCRISVLLAAGYYVVARGGSTWCLGGFIAAFFLVRLLATSWAHKTTVFTSRVKEAG